MIVPFIIILTLTFAENTIHPAITEAESLYEQYSFGSLARKLSNLRSLPNLNNATLGAINRLEGHLCLFGSKKDRNVDLSCAWKSYVEASRQGDSEGMYYAAFFLNNFLFDSLDPLKKQFGPQIAIIESTSELQGKIKGIKSLAFTLCYLSSAAGFPLANMYIGTRLVEIQSKCHSGISFFNKAAEKVLLYFNSSFDIDFRYIRRIMSGVDPFDENDMVATIENIKLREAYIMKYYIDSPQKILEMSNLAGVYFNLREYRAARKAANYVYSNNQLDPGANYVLGMFHLLGIDVPINYRAAKEYFEVAAKSNHYEAVNSLGFMHLNGLGVVKNSIMALAYFERASNLGSKSADFNWFTMKVEKGEDMSNNMIKHLYSSFEGGIIQGMYNLGVMYAYGIGIAADCSNGAKNLKNSLNTLIFRKYFNDSAKLHDGGQLKVSALQYMLMGETNDQLAQFNAANILDEKNIFTERLWIHQYLPELNINKRMALSNYLSSYELYGMYSCLRIGDFYYYGYGVPNNTDLALQYYSRSRKMYSNPTIVSYIWFNYGIMLEYGMGMDKDTINAIIAYNQSILNNPGLYIPGKITIAGLLWKEDGMFSLFPKIQILPLLGSLAFLITLIYLIIKRT